MPPTDHDLYTLRALFAAAAANAHTSLSTTMRWAILTRLRESAWVPDPHRPCPSPWINPGASRRVW